jgi:hypothetical protein
MISTGDRSLVGILNADLTVEVWKATDFAVSRTKKESPPAQCTRRKTFAYSMAADAIAALRNKAGSHHPCIAKNPDDDPANHRPAFNPPQVKVQ